MRITSVSSGDIVACDIRGIKFYAVVDARDEMNKELLIKPITHNINHFRARASQVTGHYKKMGGSR